MSTAICRTWARATSDPVTVERRVRVYDPLTGQEGYANVGWTAGYARLYGPVVRLDRVYDRDGVETEEPRATVLDHEPLFT